MRGARGASQYRVWGGASLLGVVCVYVLRFVSGCVGMCGCDVRGYVGVGLLVLGCSAGQRRETCDEEGVWSSAGGMAYASAVVMVVQQ